MRVAGDQRPLAEIRIYEQLTLLTRNTPHGYRSYPISPRDLAGAFSKVPSVSGLLPPHTLSYGTLTGSPFWLVWIPPQVVRLQVHEEFYTIPLPPLVWGGWTHEYRIWALNTPDFPSHGRLPLCDPPFPNSYESGGICWGNVQKLRAATPGTLYQALRLFLEESMFNFHGADGKSRAYPVNIVAQWKRLQEEQAEAYPLDDLVETRRTLDWACQGGAWKLS